jgi:hypothetical protein
VALVLGGGNVTDSLKLGLGRKNEEDNVGVVRVGGAECI